MSSGDEMLWTECLCPPRIRMSKPLTPSVMVFGSGAFGRYLDLDEVMAGGGGAL